MSITYRIEKDSLGEVQVDDSRLYGAQTQRSLDHFRIGGHIMPQEIIQALLIIKKCAAQTNLELGLLDNKTADLICRSIESLKSTEFHSEFPLSVWQTGSGTQTNMNVNEVIANRAAELEGLPKGKKTPIHPNDHVNRSQSSNDVFPSAMHIALVVLLRKKLIPTLDAFIQAFKEKEKEFQSIIKVGRTHLMDAVPMRLSDEISAFRAQIESGKEALLFAQTHLLELALGGTAVGTGLNCPPHFKEKVIQKIAKETSIPFIPARNSFEALSCHDSALELSGALRRIAVSYMKIANDIRLLASGPRCGIGELVLPENEPGSSIMPGKVNPTQCESMTQVACQVLGNDAAISFASTHGHFQLHVFKPLIAKNCIESIHLLADSASSFIEFCLKGMRANEPKIKSLLEQSLMLATSLSPVIGYDKAAEVALWAHHHNLSLKEAAMKLTSLSEEQFDQIVDPKKMV